VLISGITSVDVDELKNATQMSGWKAGDPEISWFWRALRSFSQEERARFLMFVTSSSRVPLGGFMQLQGASGIQPFQLQKVSSDQHLSSSSALTCSSTRKKAVYLRRAPVSTFCCCPNTRHMSSFEKSSNSPFMRRVALARHDCA